MKSQLQSPYKSISMKALGRIHSYLMLQIMPYDTPYIEKALKKILIPQFRSMF